MLGLCGGEGYGFTLAAAVQHVVWRLQEGYVVFVDVRIFSTQPRFNVFVASTTCKKKKCFCLTRDGALWAIISYKSLNTSRKSTVKDGFLFDFHYLNSLPLERGPFPSINNWHLITYLPHRCRLWSGPCSFISTLLRIDRRADRSTIKGIPPGAVNTRSPHTPRMWSSAGLSHSCCSRPSTSCWTHPVPPIWVKYSQRITNLLQWHHLRGCDCRRAYWWWWWWWGEGVHRKNL